MESRRASVLRDVSPRQRKYSTTRVLRQAELSARLEERRPVVWNTNQFSEVHDETSQMRLEIPTIRMTRADSLVSPNASPGQHGEGFPFTTEAVIGTRYERSPVRFCLDPTTAQQQDIERRAAIIKRVDTTSTDWADREAHVYNSLTTRPVTYHPFRRWSTWMPSTRKAREPSLANGLHIATGMHTALGLNFLAHKSPEGTKRQQLHIMQYTTDKHNVFSCDNHTAFRDTEVFKQHLLQIETDALHFDDRIGVRLLHIRNNIDAFKYVDQAFAISSPAIHYGERGFREWIKEDRDSGRASNMTIRWRPGFDMNRRVLCMALGIDLGFSPFASELSNTSHREDLKQEQTSSRKCRIAVYMQRCMPKANPSPRIPHFNSRGTVFEEFAKQDNVVICEYSSDAHSEISNTPALLTLSPLARLHQEGNVAIMASVMSEIFWEVVSKWHTQIASIHQPFADLEERIYAEPSDISHSNEVWEWSRNLQNMLKLIVRHLKAIQTFQDDFVLFGDLSNDVEWLDDVLGELKHMADNIRGDYIEPLEHMIDLMYKSVTIRDSRMSLELGTSLWRLSWITFIFLPLTFLVGFFGMNVDTFQDNPSIKWYFVALVPLVFIVGTFWYAFTQIGLAYQMKRPSNSTIVR